MHYTGTIWRPSYESRSLLIEVTAGCTHHKCKFCTLYDELPFQFRMSPFTDIEADLAESSLQIHSWPNTKVNRVYLVGANPFVLTFDRLKRIAELIHQYIPECTTIGCFSRITDIGLKNDKELYELSKLGYDGITIGVETGDDQALSFMEKGYQAKDIVEQTHRLDAAGISYHFFYLSGISGFGKGMMGATKSADIFNQTHPKIIGSSMLTIYPESKLYEEILNGNWKEEGEIEKIEEVKTLISLLNIPVYFATLGASNAVWIEGELPKDKQRMIAQLESACHSVNETQLRNYRKDLNHL